MPSWKAPPSGSTAPPPAWASIRPRYSTLSYGRLFELWRDEHHSAAQDLTFAAVAQAG
jgi:hypothetical protein